jgi:hypothetical protein
MVLGLEFPPIAFDDRLHASFLPEAWERGEIVLTYSVFQPKDQHLNLLHHLCRQSCRGRTSMSQVGEVRIWNPHIESIGARGEGR